MKKQNLELSVEKRDSNAFYSNLEFSANPVSYRIEHAELGESKRIPGGLSWETPFGRLEQVEGVLKLIETESPKSYKRIEIV